MIGLLFQLIWLSETQCEIDLGTHMENKEYIIRNLEREDFDRGFVECINQLTVPGNVSKKVFLEKFEALNENPDYHILVAYEPKSNLIIGSGTLFIEQKFIRGCTKKGHIEDIVVLKSRRGLGIGKEIVSRLIQLADDMNCYKTALVCEDRNVGFYEKCGLVPKEREMVKYHE